MCTKAWGYTYAWSLLDHRLAGRATIAVCWVLYVGHFINTRHNPVFSVLLVLIGLWIPAAINLSGVKNMDPVVAGRRRPLGPL
jgi:APA family basic amino acid/polyamine antiporter